MRSEVAKRISGKTSVLNKAKANMYAKSLISEQGSLTEDAKSQIRKIANETFKKMSPKRVCKRHQKVYEINELKYKIIVDVFNIEPYHFDVYISGVKHKYNYSRIGILL